MAGLDRRTENEENNMMLSQRAVSGRCADHAYCVYFKNNANQTIRIPKDMQVEGVTELEIRREGSTILLRPVRANWTSFANEAKAENYY